MPLETLTKSAPASKGHFLNLTPGKLMGLREITDSEGRFKVLALDQSNSFKKSLKAMHARLKDGKEPDYAEVSDAKLEMTREMGIAATAVLLDVNFGLRQCLNSGSLPRGVGLLARVEASRDAGLPGELEPGWSVAQIKKMGASAVKLLVYMDTEDTKTTAAQMEFVKKIHRDCQEQDILLLVEELSYPRAGEDKKSPSYVARKSKNIVESAKLIGPYCDILKLEFPASMDESAKSIKAKLDAVNAAAMRPWVLLSAGEKFDIFVKQVELAMKAGSSGIMAGRAIFNEYFDQNTPKARNQFLKTTGLKRFRTLAKIVDRYAQGWQKRTKIAYQDLAAAVKPDWYSAGAQTKQASADAEY